MRKLLQELAECERMMKRAEGAWVPLHQAHVNPNAQIKPPVTEPSNPGTKTTTASPAVKPAGEPSETPTASQEPTIPTAPQEQTTPADTEKARLEAYRKDHGKRPEWTKETPTESIWSDPTFQSNALTGLGVGLLGGLGGYALTGGQGGLAPWLMLGGGVGAGIGGLSGYNQWNANKTEYEDIFKKQKIWDAGLAEFDPFAIEVDSKEFKPVLRSARQTPVSQRVDTAVEYEPDMSYTQKGTSAGKRLRGEARMLEIEREQHNLQHELYTEIQKIENRTDLDSEAKRLQVEALQATYAPKFKALQTEYDDALILREGGTPSLGEMFYDGAAAWGWHPSVAWIPGGLNVIGGLPKAIIGNTADVIVPGDYHQYAGYFQPKTILDANKQPEPGRSIRHNGPQSATMTGSMQFTDQGRAAYSDLIRKGYKTQDAIAIIATQEEKSPGTYYVPEAYFDTSSMTSEEVENLVYDANGDRLPFQQGYRALREALGQGSEE